MNGYRSNFKGYLKSLAKRKPCPGGGSAVSLVFCLGVSLIEKAINYSLILKPKSPKERLLNSEFKKSVFILRRLRQRVYFFIDQDSCLFGKIMSSKGKRQKAFIVKSEQLLVETGKSCEAVFCLIKMLELKIKKGIISDFNIGRDLIKSVLFGCILNLEANARLFGSKNKYIGGLKKSLKKWQRQK